MQDDEYYGIDWDRLLLIEAEDDVEASVGVPTTPLSYFFNLRSKVTVSPHQLFLHA